MQVLSTTTLEVVAYDPFAAQMYCRALEEMIEPPRIKQV